MTQQKPARKPFANFREANRVFLESFEAWLLSGGYSLSTRSNYLVAARSALKFLNKPHWSIRPDVDLNVKLRAWEDIYNYDKPHPSLEGKTPYEVMKYLLE